MTLSTYRKAGQLVSGGRLVRIVRWLCAVLVLQLSTGFATAQQNVAKPEQQVQREPRDLLKEEITASQNQTTKKSPESLSEGGLPETPKMLQAREEYTVFAWKNRQDAFAWQSVSTKVIFWVVIVVVLTGLYLSWMQFNLAHKMPLTKTTQTKKGQSNKANPSDQIEASTIEVTTSGVKITSSVIGLIILVLSIVFFFLYLKFVYPIIEV
jgi:hypothetical protein